MCGGLVSWLVANENEFGVKCLLGLQFKLWFAVGEGSLKLGYLVLNVCLGYSSSYGLQSVREV